MKGSGRKLHKEPTNGVIYEPDGSICEHGLRIICPHCGEVGVHMGNGGAVNIWAVGAEELMECTKCRKQFSTITLTVPVRQRPVDFYKKVSEALQRADQAKDQMNMEEKQT